MTTLNKSERRAIPGASGPLVIEQVGPVIVFFRRLVFFTSWFVLWLGGALVWLDLLWRTGLSELKWVIWLLYLPLHAQLVFGFLQAFYGFLIRRKRARHRRTAGDEKPPALKPRSTVIVIPVYNEDPPEVFARIRAIYRDLESCGILDVFEFFVLSDTRDPDCWVQEEQLWLQLRRELGAMDRLHYRRRRHNLARKSGNISDFLRKWGRNYTYMVVLDADSLMTGETLHALVTAMVAHPNAGLIQTVPRQIRPASPFARLMQFTSAFYTPIFAAGLRFWHHRGGNYWGHNAIIRIAPFCDACELPRLPWREPIGGQILSHDFVEAALMRRAGYDVYLADALHGSFEESPPHLLAHLARDRRWCQGNLQHLWLLFARGLRWTSRLHFLNGILAYVGSALWFGFLLVSLLSLNRAVDSGLSLIVTPSALPSYRGDLNEESLALLAFTGLLLFAPKWLAWLDAALRGKMHQFGGYGRATLSMGLETLFSTLHAPIMMFYHTLFVITSLLGVRAEWTTQNRTLSDMPWGVAAKALGSASVCGILLAMGSYSIDPILMAWFSPIILGLILAVPMTVILSSASVDHALRSAKIWYVPEEANPPSVVKGVVPGIFQYRAVLDALPLKGAAAAIIDPGVNALHTALQEPCSDTSKAFAGARKEVMEAILKNGWQALPPKELAEWMCDREAMIELHYRIWHVNEPLRHPDITRQLLSYATRFPGEATR